MRGKPVGRSLVLGVLVVTIGLLFAQALTRPRPGYYFDQRRAELLARLRADDDLHLVVVTYGERHSSHEEWVNNEADIDAAEVVWARDMGAESNRALIESFEGRRVWRLRVGFGTGPPELVPYD